jgi:hypothetical protein
MSLPLLPPKTEPLVDDDKFTTLNWLAFFDTLANGDTGTAWTPTFVGLTETGGTATKTGRYFRISKTLAYFRIVITPVTDTSAVAGTTYCDNFPLLISQAGVCVTLSSFTAAVSGVTAADKRIYTAAWTTITSPITLVGLLEVR